MSGPSSARKVKLIDARDGNRRMILAELYRDYPASQLEVIEAQWAEAREHAATTGRGEGLAPLEHAHWDWRLKMDSVEAGRHMLVAVDCDGEAQGVMAVLRIPKPARLSTNHVVYVDYLESAPWNLKGFSDSPRFFGVGTVLMVDGVRLSLEMGLHGRVGLHSLPQAEPFYERCGMTRIGPDVDYYDLTYFEFSPDQAKAWLASIGESE